MRLSHIRLLAAAAVALGFGAAGVAASADTAGKPDAGPARAAPSAAGSFVLAAARPARRLRRVPMVCCKTPKGPRMMPKTHCLGQVMPNFFCKKKKRPAIRGACCKTGGGLKWVPTAAHCPRAPHGQIVHKGKCRGGLPGQIKVCCAVVVDDESRALRYATGQECQADKGESVSLSNCRKGKVVLQECCREHYWDNYCGPKATVAAPSLCPSSGQPLSHDSPYSICCKSLSWKDASRCGDPEPVSKCL